MTTDLTHESAYRKGWEASKRTTTADLDAADERFTSRHGHAFRDAFLNGWTDHAADNPFHPWRKGERPIHVIHYSSGSDYEPCEGKRCFFCRDGSRVTTENAHAAYLQERYGNL